MHNLREAFERRQVSIYFGALIIAAIIAYIVPSSAALEGAINPALGFMLFVTFLQVPLIDLRRAFTQMRFLGALLIVNFIAIPGFVAILIQFAPDDPIAQLGMLLVLLTPCIDYVVTFSHLGRADARLLLASTPILLIVQMLLLPVYLGSLLGKEAASLVKIGPFVQAFVWLIAVPFMLAALVQIWSARSKLGERTSTFLGMLPVPSTALVLFIVIASVVPQLESAAPAALGVAPIYIAFAVIAPLLGWSVARLLRLQAPAGRAVAFSAGTRNSLVVLPLALAVPGAVPVLPAVIVTQTLIELISELIYIRLIAKLDSARTVPSLT